MTLTVVATLLTNGAEAERYIILPKGELTLEPLLAFQDMVLSTQLLEIYAGVRQLRRAYSSRLVTHVLLRQVSWNRFSRTEVGSDDARARLESGGVLISLPSKLALESRGAVGRPEALPIDDAFKRSFGKAIARILRLGDLADEAEYRNFQSARNMLEQELQRHASLFNLNTHHETVQGVKVIDWCETHGPRLLAEAYGMEEPALERAHQQAFGTRLRARSYAEVLEEEFNNVEILSAWADAYTLGKAGRVSKRDTTRRLINKQGLSWETAPGAIDPPVIHGPVRRKLVAQDALASLDTTMMMRLAMLFDLEPAYNVFLTRLYCLPLFGAAGLAGRMALRCLPGELDSPITAGGLVGLWENRNAEPDAIMEQLGINEAQDEIALHRQLLRSNFERAGLDVQDLAERAGAFLETGQPTRIVVPERQVRFFVDG